MGDGGGGTRRKPLFRGGARWGVAGGGYFTAARADARRSLPNPALRGSIRPAPGLGVLLTPCVIHWRLKRRRFGLGAWTSMAMAALGGAGLAGERREGHSRRGLWCKGGACVRAGSGRTQARVTQGWGGLQKAWPWRSGGGGTPAAVLCQPSGLRPKCLGAKGGTGLQGAHRGVVVDGAAAQGGRRRSPGGGRGRRSRRRSLVTPGL